MKTYYLSLAATFARPSYHPQWLSGFSFTFAIIYISLTIILKDGVMTVSDPRLSVQYLVLQNVLVYS